MSSLQWTNYNKHLLVYQSITCQLFLQSPEDKIVVACWISSVNENKQVFVSYGCNLHPFKGACEQTDLNQVNTTIIVLGMLLSLQGLY